MFTLNRLILLSCAAVILPACGGSGGGSFAPVVAPVVTFDSISPNPFTPPATTTATFTISGGASAWTAIAAYLPTGAPNTFQFLGEKDTRQTSIGAHSYDWDGFTLYVQGGPRLPVFLKDSDGSSVGLYSVRVRRQLMKMNGVGVSTGAQNPEDLNFFFVIDHQNLGAAFHHAEDLVGNPVPFPVSGGVPGQPGWVYYERAWIYDVFLDATNHSLTYTLNPAVVDPWNNPALALIASAGAYSLELHVWNSAGEDFTPFQTVTIP